MSILSTTEYYAVMRACLASFIHRSFYELNPQTPYLPNWHIELMAAKLEAVMRGECRRLIITLPPRHLKSHAVSIAFIAWYLGHHPSRHVISVSYGQDLASRFARECRTLMDSEFYKTVFRTRLSGRKVVDDFTTTELGTRMATSVGGVLTGRGGDILVIDDALKPDEALSETRRNAVNEWYDNTLLSRLNDKTNGAIVIIMQRLHQDDLIGHVLEQEDWEVVSFPAIAEEDETHCIQSAFGQRIVRRQQGEVLHPAREPVKTLRQMRQAMGEYTFVSQYQQNPMPKDGFLVKRAWFKTYVSGEQPNSSWIVQSWDTASKTGELNDYSVCTTWMVHGRNFYLIDVFRKRMNYPDLKRAVLELAQRFKACAVVIEDKASGTAVIQDLREAGLTSVKAYEPPSGTDKVMRLHLQTPVIENGRVYLPISAPWLGEFLSEVTGFPGSKHDDQVDSMTQALAHLAAPSTAEKLMIAYGD
jgi:predicted phage terminase large subunit-like protein